MVKSTATVGFTTNGSGKASATQGLPTNELVKPVDSTTNGTGEVVAAAGLTTNVWYCWAG